MTYMYKYTCTLKIDPVQADEYNVQAVGTSW